MKGTRYEISVAIINEVLAMEESKNLSTAVENFGEDATDKVCNQFEDTNPDEIWEIFGNLKRHLGLV